MRRRGFCVIDYIDDYVGMGVPGIARASFASLFSLMKELGLTISDSKLVPPSTKVVCLGVLIDTEKGTVSIPPDKLRQVNDTVRHWMTKDTCTKRQLQSLLGLLLYVHKCVKPARAFLNRMLALLRAGHASQQIHLTPECDFVYHLPIPLGFMNWSIVQLEMVNILLAVKLFHAHWANKKC